MCSVDLKTFLPSHILTLSKSFEQGKCTEEFFQLLEQQWIQNVPLIFRSKSVQINQIFDEKRAKEELIQPLQWFITGSLEPEDIFDKLKSISKPPQLCGRVFKQGEPNYNCRECSADSTCVLCVECFKNSVHRNHSYRICNSSSGYCDCGDPEAWKTSPICSLHMEKNNQHLLSSMLANLMSESEFNSLNSRLRLVFQYVLDYIYLMLKWDKQDVPKPFERSDCDDDFVVILYNDETHTYEHVILALTNSIKCDKKLATDYATAVDREGRCIIWHENREKCQSMARNISLSTINNQEKSLEVKVLSTDLVAHQTFAIRLMSWILDLMPICVEFRQAFADYLYKANHKSGRFGFDEPPNNKMLPEFSLLEKIIRSDTWFWKSIRILWHQLFMGGLLLDIDLKRIFAHLFTRHYSHLVHDYIYDDHEYRVSVVSLSVQIYTVPSIASSLIENDNAITIFINSFLELNHRYHQSGKFKFDNLNTLSFKRSMDVLCDLQYLLTKTSDTFQWTDQMRYHFIEGAEAFIKLLKRTQNIDSIIRQVSQHIEYEPGWDIGMFFETRLGPIIKLFVDWIITDRYVFLSVFNLALRIAKDSFDFYSNGGNKENQNPLTNSLCTTVRRHYAGKSVRVWDYNVGRKEISIHIPLSRFITALMLHLPKYDLWSEFNDYSCSTSTVLTSHRLNTESTMELSLRIQVLLAQYRAGMWRRNGYSLINQIMIYHSTRLRTTAFDLDILSLQLAAAILDANEFMLHLIYKFNVDRMLDSDIYTPIKFNEDTTLHHITLIEEFFRLIYTILVERYTVGLGNVTKQDCIKNEIIQWLCKESMSNSNLLSHLSQNEVDKNTEDLILELAEFKPSNSFNTGGRYVLKEPYYQHFNPFYYHYSRQDQSVAIINQIRRKRDKKDQYCCCPPPPLPDFIPLFQPINNILLCDVTMTIIKCVLEKAILGKDIYYSDFQFQQCLYLIGIALNEQMKRPEQFRFTDKLIEFGIVSLLEQFTSKHIIDRVEMYQPLYDWCLDRLKQVQQLNANNPNVTESKELCQTSDNNLALHLRDREQERDLRRKQALIRKEKILKQMEQQQQSFMKENEQYFKENLSRISVLDNSTIEEHNVNPDNNENIYVAFGNKRTTDYPKLDNDLNNVYICILCLESEDINKIDDGRYLLLAGFIQRSTVLSKNRDIQSWSTNYINCLLPRSDHNFGPFINTCTHFMHNDCFDKYIETSMNNDRRRLAHRHPRTTFDFNKREFLCPLCECLSNLTIPIMPSLTSPVKPSSLTTVISMNQWLNAMVTIMQNCKTICFDHSQYLDKVNGFNENFSQLTNSLPSDLKEKLYQLQSEYISNMQPSIDPNSDTFRNIQHNIVDVFCESIHKAINDVSTIAKNDGHDVIQSINWTISFTIQVLERSMRLDECCLSDLVDKRQYQSLKVLISFIRAQLNFIMPAFPRRVFLYLMNYLLVNTVYQSCPSHILDVDAFSILISLMTSTTSFFDDYNDSAHSSKPFLMYGKKTTHREHFFMPLGNSFDKNLIELMLFFHIVQIILTNSDFDSMEEPMEIDADAKIEPELSETDPTVVALFCKDILIAAGHKFSEENLMNNASKITAFIKSNLLPFLRSTAIFAHFLTETPWPKKIWLKSKDGVKVSNNEEYDLLCQYLAIECNLSSLMQIASLRHLCLSWARHEKLSTVFICSNGHSTVLNLEHRFLRQPHSINRLVNLPYDYTDLVNSVANFTCPNSNGEESRSPTMCLICGVVLCSQNYCCQQKVGNEFVGACTYHSQKCSASVGLFLQIRVNRVLLLASRGRGCYLHSPYVDKFGETDSGLYRGYPLFLCKMKFEKLYKLWFRHGIYEQIVRLLETSSTFASTNWTIM